MISPVEYRLPAPPDALAGDTPAVHIPGPRTSSGPAPTPHDAAPYDAAPPDAAPTADASPAVWVVNVVQEADAAVAVAADILDAEEQKRAADFRRDEHRRAYTAAHVALRMLLGARLGIAPAAVPFTRETCPTCGGPHGRPAVAGGGLHFSLSHSGDLALVAMADTTIGADVEKMPTLHVADQTAHMLHPDEAEELGALPDDARAEAFGRVWVRKEAYLKALGTGLSRGLSLDYLGTGPTPAAGPSGWSLVDVRVPDGYLAAVAVATPTAAR